MFKIRANMKKAKHIVSCVINLLIPIDFLSSSNGHREQSEDLTQITAYEEDIGLLDLFL